MTEQTETRPYRPCNGTEGEAFIAGWCAKCEYEEKARQDETCSGCEVLGATMAFDIDSEHYPGEWVSDPDGKNPRCTKFRKVGTGTWEQARKDQDRYEQAMAEMREAQLEQARRDERNTDHELLDDIEAEQRAEADAEERRALEQEKRRVRWHGTRNPSRP